MKNKKKIIFLVVGNQRLGTGHIYRSIIYRKELASLGFICHTFYQKGDDLVNEIYKEHSLSSDQVDYLTDKQVRESKDNVYILDILDTSVDFIKAIKKYNTVIAFEDLGPGSEYSDLVINALYKQKKITKNHYYGHKYVELRDEFQDTKYTINETIKNILITFGGTDPTNSTYIVLNAIYEFCKSNNITINVVNGPGYQYIDSLNDFPDINIKFNVDNMARIMMENDIAFCSAGRTIYELASIGVPSIVLTHNERENHHLFATQEYGFINLGLSNKVKEKEILNTYLQLADNYNLRKHISNIMLEHNLKSGKERVTKLILKTINEE